MVVVKIIYILLHKQIVRGNSVLFKFLTEFDFANLIQHFDISNYRKATLYTPLEKGRLETSFNFLIASQIKCLKSLQTDQTHNREVST